MAETYQVFKLIMGIIASVILLAVLLNYAGSYAAVQRETQRAMIMKNFEKGIRDVYQTGVPLAFTSRIGLLVVPGGLASPGELNSLNKLSISLPLIVLDGNDLTISRGSVDYGFWSFTYVTALPTTTFLFAFEAPSTVDLAIEAVKAFPETLPGKPGARFAICRGSTIEKPCQGYCNREDFLSFLASRRTTLQTGSCTADGQLVTFASSCASKNRGACFIPQTTILNARVGGVDTYYKDPVDMLALIVGSDRQQVFGTEGLLLLDNVHTARIRELRTVAEVMGDQVSYLAQGYRSQGNTVCAGLYQGVINQNLFPQIVSLTSTEQDPVIWGQQFASLTTQLRRAHTTLKEAGCV